MKGIIGIMLMALIYGSPAHAIGQTESVNTISFPGFPGGKVGRK